MTDLKKILGVGKVKAEKIIEAGYADAEAFSALSDEALADKPFSLKPESIASLRELVGNESGSESTSDQTTEQPSASLQEEESTDQEPASTEDSAEEQDQTSTPSEDGSEQEPEAESSPAEQPQESEESSTEQEPESAEQPEPKVIEFRLSSGKHKNRVLMWNTANPSAQFKDGLYVSLSVLTVAKRAKQPIEGETAFNLIYGQTTNGASLPDAEFKAFMEALAKKQPRHQRTRLG